MLLTRKIWFEYKKYCIFIGFIVLFALIVRLNLSYSSEYTEVRINESIRCSSNVNALLYVLAKPQSKFHSHHWFHLGEYYISQIENISSNVSNYSNQLENIFIAVNNERFLIDISPMSIFLLSLAFCKNTKKVTILYPKRISSSSNYSNSLIKSSNTNLIYYYINTTNYEFQFKTQNAVHKSFGKSTIECAKYMGTYGYKPVQSDRWFLNIDNVNKFRESLSLMCPIEINPLPQSLVTSHLYPYNSANTSDLLVSSKQLKKNKLLVYQRDLNRQFSNFNDVLSQLNGALGSQWAIDVLNHNEQIHPCVYYKALQETDIFLTTHGFQSIGIIFMRPGSVIFEVFPYKYFKPSYSRLSPQFGVKHQWVQNQNSQSWSRYYLRFISQDTCMKNKRCRSHARGDNVTLNDNDMKLVLQTAKDIDNGIISGNNAVYTFYSEV